MGAVLNPEQWPLMADLQAKDQRAQAGGERRGSRRGSGREAAASAHFLLKICFKVSPAHLPQGTPQFPRLCGENERVMRWEEERETERKRPGVGQAERHREKEARWSLKAERTQQSAGLQGGLATRKGAGREKGQQGEMHLGLDQEKSEQLWYWDPDARVLSFSR